MIRVVLCTGVVFRVTLSKRCVRVLAFASGSRPVRRSRADATGLAPKNRLGPLSRSSTRFGKRFCVVTRSNWDVPHLIKRLTGPSNMIRNLRIHSLSSTSSRHN